VLELNLQATRGLLPDRTFLVVLDPEAAARRTRRPDRIEQEGLEFQREVDRAYRELAQLFPNRITTLDGARSASELAKEVRDELRAFA
jgi:dTMP kinase